MIYCIAYIGGINLVPYQSLIHKFDTQIPVSQFFPLIEIIFPFTEYPIFSRSHWRSYQDGELQYHMYQ